MLNTSFTLRPCSKDNGEGGIEVTLREARDSVSTHYARRVIHNNSNERVAACHHTTRDEREFYQQPRHHHIHPERALKRQRLFATSGQHQQHQYPHMIIPDVMEEPKIRRIPMEFEPPSSEEYWKKRCYRWQVAHHYSQHRMRDMEEDQHQLRRRVQQLEKQLLTQSSNSTATRMPEGKAETSSASLLDQSGHSNIDGRMNNGGDKDDNDDGAAGTSSPREQIVAFSGTAPKHCSSRSRDPNHNDLPPAVVTISKTYAAASCIYLTDGEGLSDSELHYDDDDDDMDDEHDDDEADERDDTSRQRRG